MLSVSLGGPDRPLRRLLAIGAHSDDIEIGCGGTLLRLIQQVPDLEVYWLVVAASLSNRADEARASAQAMLSGVTQHTIQIESFRDGFLPYEGMAVKETFEALKARFQPDLILTHYGRDAHQDHRLTSELTWNTFRDHAILEFEIPKYDGDIGNPNVFVRLDDAHVQRKVDHLRQYFPSQHGRQWFSDELFSGLMRVRGMECNSPTRYAEAFYARKVSI